MFNQSSEAMNTFDITDVGHIERIVVGSITPGEMPTEQDNQAKMARINRCLSDFPKGRIIGVERSFSVVRVGEHQVVLEAVVYHIGFKKVPMWLKRKSAVNLIIKLTQRKLINLSANIKTKNLP
ncbi:hypothetical protein [Marinomonas sp. PE14-40]|uniref:hypothetical protein n=1 Tax=Marinomonas sp. PE14-40 TaxID=3060621 RepID=UPI003F66B0DD